MIACCGLVRCAFFFHIAVCCGLSMEFLLFAKLFDKFPAGWWLDASVDAYFSACLHYSVPFCIMPRLRKLPFFQFPSKKMPRPGFLSYPKDRWTHSILLSLQQSAPASTDISFKLSQDSIFLKFLARGCLCVLFCLIQKLT